ncbi:acidic mammalian chitinase-like isoform X2 [Homalodisca vitripennis]|uniref:acidic mammalian chitinase-like isoform X2 n=1 Tax=Homalodisca vitripennis TaxID=197043 RepID=UPI001EEC727A|nr:acidic mammalian chitinase-like isoform X2 [Homalodisca vitripennis]
MTVPRSGSQVKYELLEENKRTAVKASHLWSAVLLVILITCSSIIALYLTWQHMVNVSKEQENLDFLMVGPTKSSGGYSWKSRQLGGLYSQAEREMSRDLHWSQPHLVLNMSHHAEPPEYMLVCYYNLPNGGSTVVLKPDLLDPDLCSHINIAFATVGNGTIQPNLPSDLEVYKGVTALKKKNPRLKVMLSVEWFTSTGEFAWIVSSPENRTRFVDEAVKFLEAYEMDGLDLDWEFPNWPTVVTNQTNCFTELLRQLSASFRQRESPLLLSVAAGAPKPIIDNSYNISAMADYIDFVNVMAYDYHMYQPYLPLTGANAPLYERQVEKGYFTTLNLNWTAAYWLYKGMPASKIIIGVPTYGHSFTLLNEENNGWDAPSSGIHSAGSDGFV